jgi:hypothetical protein
MDAPLIASGSDDWKQAGLLSFIRHFGAAEKLPWALMKSEDRRPIT